MHMATFISYGYVDSIDNRQFGEKREKKIRHTLQEKMNR